MNNISQLLAMKEGAISMPDLKKIAADYKLVSAAIRGDDELLKKRAGDADPLGAIEVMAARHKAALLIAKSKSRLDALINLELETLQKVEKYVTGLVEGRRERRPIMRRSFQACMEADEIWRETHPGGHGPYSDAPRFGGDRVEKVETQAANVADVWLRRRFQG
jgi:hypothetical protein